MWTAGLFFADSYWIYPWIFSTYTLIAIQYTLIQVLLSTLDVAFNFSDQTGITGAGLLAVNAIITNVDD